MKCDWFKPSNHEVIPLGVIHKVRSFEGENMDEQGEVAPQKTNVRFGKKNIPSLRPYKSMPLYVQIPDFNRFEKSFFFSITGECTKAGYISACTYINENERNH